MKQTLHRDGANIASRRSKRCIETEQTLIEMEQTLIEMEQTLIETEQTLRCMQSLTTLSAIKTYLASDSLT